MKDTVIIGIGNILLKDDGVGVHVVKQMEQENPPSNLELVDGGTSTLDTLSYFLAYNKVIIIDSLKAGYEPGTIYKIRPEDINHYQKESLSVHDVQILDVVKMANMLGEFPHVIIFGIEPQEIAFGLEMTETVKNSIPGVIGLVNNELAVEQVRTHA